MVNKVILVGNVGREPETKQLPSGGTVASFSLATTRKWRDGNGERREETTWHNVKAFGKLSDVIAQYVHKGDRLYVEGRISVREWTDDGGQKHSRTEIVCDQLTMLGSKRDAGPREEPGSQVGPASPPSADDDLSEIPF